MYIHVHTEVCGSVVYACVLVYRKAMVPTW